MKKRSLKSLKLNKTVISGFEIKAGGAITISEYDGPQPGGGWCMSEAGCTDGPDETMTCPDWSCKCPTTPVVIQ